MHSMYKISFFCVVMATYLSASMQDFPIKAIYRKSTSDHTYYNIEDKKEGTFSEETKGGQCIIWHNTDTHTLFFQKIDPLTKTPYDKAIALAQGEEDLGKIPNQLQTLFSNTPTIVELNDKHYLVLRRQVGHILNVTPYHKIEDIATFYSENKDNQVSQLLADQEIPIVTDKLKKNPIEGCIKGYINEVLVVEVSKDNKSVMIGLTVAEGLYAKIKGKMDKKTVPSSELPSTVYAQYLAPEKREDTVDTQQYLRLIEDTNKKDSTEVPEILPTIQEVSRKPNDNACIISAISIHKIPASNHHIPTYYEIRFEVAGNSFIRFASLSNSNTSTPIHYLDIRDIIANTFVCFDIDNITQPSLVHYNEKKKEQLSHSTTSNIETLLLERGFGYTDTTNIYRMLTSGLPFKIYQPEELRSFFLPKYTGMLKKTDAEATLCIYNEQKLINISLGAYSLYSGYDTMQKIFGTLLDPRGIPFMVIEATIEKPDPLSDDEKPHSTSVNPSSLWSFLTTHKIPIGTGIGIGIMFLAWLFHKKQ